MTYYFGKFEDAGQSQIGDTGVSERQRLLSELATGLDSYEKLANEVSETCDTLASDVSSDWEDRGALRDNDFGVPTESKARCRINIRPLAEAKIVPKTVEDDVL